MITTDVYRMSASTLGHRLAADLLWRWWWLPATPLAVLLVWGMSDWRMLIAALALVLIVYPAAMMMAYYYHALTPEAVRAIMPQRAEISSQGITITYFAMVEGGTALPPRHIPLADVVDAEDNGRELAITLRDRSKIYIPASAFPAPASLPTALTLLRG